MDLASTKETFSSFVSALSAAHPDLAYIHAVESRIAGNTTIPTPEGEELDFLYDLWTPRTFLVAGGFTAESAITEAKRRKNTVVVMGRYFISNVRTLPGDSKSGTNPLQISQPDLVARIKHSVPFADYNHDTFYLYGPTHTKGSFRGPFSHRSRADAASQDTPTIPSPPSLLASSRCTPLDGRLARCLYKYSVLPGKHSAVLHSFEERESFAFLAPEPRDRKSVV